MKKNGMHRVVTPVHPTVAAEFQIRAARALGGDGERFYWLRGDCAGDDVQSLAECEKAALAHLRALPARLP